MNKQFWIPVVAVLIFTASSMSAFAELNAGTLVNTFNGMNGGAGFHFTFRTWGTGTNTTGQIETQAGYTTNGNVNIGAYTANSSGTTTGSNWFRSFCVTPEILISGGNYIGTLDWKAGTGVNAGKMISQTSDGKTLSLGAAYLYMLYATSNDGIVLGQSFNAGALSQAINVLNGGNFSYPDVSGWPGVTTWNDNIYLNALLGKLNDTSYWTQAYDARQNDYGVAQMGNYSVFVMRVKDSSGVEKQNFLYIAEATPIISGVPEPATMLLWSLGGMGLVGSWVRQRRLKKLAIA